MLMMMMMMKIVDKNDDLKQLTNIFIAYEYSTSFFFAAIKSNQNEENFIYKRQQQNRLVLMGKLMFRCVIFYTKIEIIFMVSSECYKVTMNMVLPFRHSEVKTH